MHLINPDLHTRRAFLRRSGQLAFTGAAMPMAMNLAAIGEAAAQTATDYKALVCVFLYGGNDYANTVVNYDQASYDLYAKIRGGAGQDGGGIALARTGLTPLQAAVGGKEYAFHPSMGGMANLFNTGKTAVILNTGPLFVPTSRADYFGTNRAAYPLPPKLFSHNDQQSLWQSKSPEGSTVGWGGNIADRALSTNGNGSLFTAVSVTGNSVFLSGNTAFSYQVSTNGAVKIYTVGDSAYPYGMNPVGKSAAKLIVNAAGSSILGQEYNKVTKRSIDAEVTVSAAIAGSKANASNIYPAPFDKFKSISVINGANTNNPLAEQLRMVARMIKARDGLGVKRQVFLVSMGGFDLHDNLITGHVKNMQRVSEAMTAFYEATVDLGVVGNVTAFTASDFGRTLASNGDGSDHGWGSHHMVVGGAVKGKQFYGYAPPVGSGARESTADVDLWQVGQGRLLPTTSVDQYAATLAKWFGVADADLQDIVPNLANFGKGSISVGGQQFAYPKDVGFMNPA